MSAVLNSFPGVPFESRSKLPEVPAIYFVMHGDTVLYVGRSVNIRQRWSNHHHTKDLLPIADEIVIRWDEMPIDVLPSAEREYRDLFRPPLNGDVPPLETESPTEMPVDVVLNSPNDDHIEIVHPRTGQKLHMNAEIAARMVVWLPSEPNELTAEDADAVFGVAGHSQPTPKTGAAPEGTQNVT